MTQGPCPARLPVSEARENLAAIIARVQAPEAACVLTRHGKPVAAVVSMATLARIRRDEDMERFADPRERPGGVLRPDGTFAASSREAAEIVREVQLRRWQERQALERVGLQPLEGGELMVDAVEPAAVAEPVVARRRWWQRRGGRA